MNVVGFKGVIQLGQLRTVSGVLVSILIITRLSSVDSVYEILKLFSLIDPPLPCRVDTVRDKEVGYVAG